MDGFNQNIQNKDTPDILLGCAPLYPPVELFYSMGITPQVLWGLKDILFKLSESDRHLQNYACSVARCLAQYVLSDKGANLSGLFMYNACDTLRNLPEILKWGLAEVGRTLPVFTVHIPMGSTACDRNSVYLKQEIATLIHALEDAFAVSFCAKRFEESIKTYDEMRNLLKQMDVLVAAGKLRFDEYVQFARQGCRRPVDQQISSLKSRLRDFEPASLDSIENQIAAGGVVLSGILPPPAGISRAIENASLRIVGNDIALLSRSFGGRPGPCEDPAEYYRSYYQSHYPCPTLLHTADRRIETLMNLITERQASGVIFIGEKFCEYEYFEIPHLQKQLREKHLHSLFLELSMDDSDHIDAFQTRIEAFSELMSQNNKP